MAVESSLPFIEIPAAAFSKRSYTQRILEPEEEEEEEEEATSCVKQRASCALNNGHRYVLVFKLCPLLVYSHFYSYHFYSSWFYCMRKR